MNCDDDSVPVWEEVANYEDDDDNDKNDDDIYVKEVSNYGDVRWSGRWWCKIVWEKTLWYFFIQVVNFG